MSRFTVNRALIEGPSAALSQLLDEGSQEKAQAQAAIAHEFAQRFSEKHRVQLEFEDEAVSKLVARAEREKTYMRDLCERLFKDYEFGLKLVQEQTKGEVLRVPGSAIDDPDKFLSDWLVKHYRKETDGAKPTESSE